MTNEEEDEPQEVQIFSADEIKTNTSVLATKMTAAGDVTGLRTGRSIDDRDAGVDLTEDGRIVAQTAGPTPAKDDRELRTGQGLVNYFNAQGAHWGPRQSWLQEASTSKEWTASPSTPRPARSSC